MKKSVLKSIAFVLVLTLLMGMSGAQANSQHAHLKQHFNKALRTYSSAMGAELYQKNDLLSNQVHNLIAERKLFMSATSRLDCIQSL
jgi:hypothetical protein